MVIFVILLTYLCRPVYAQDNISPTSIPNKTFTEYQTEYFSAQNKYLQSYSIYQEKKLIDSKYSTVATQQEKFEAIKKALIERNTMLQVYIIALRSKLDQYKQFNETPTVGYQMELDKWKEWLNTQNQIISNFDNPKQITPWINNFKINYKTILYIIYSSLNQNEINIKTQTTHEIKGIMDRIDRSPSVTSDGRLLLNNLPQSFLLIDSQIEKAKSNISKTSGDSSNSYNSAKKDLSVANIQLLQIVNNLKLIIVKSN